MLPDHPYNVPFIRLILDSHHRLLGTPAIASNRDLNEAARWLYEDAPFCLLAHTADEDPRFCYANLTAQRCFGYNWNEFTQLPSRLSAEPDNLADRTALLKGVAENGFAMNYRGQRIASNGQRFWIENVKVWNLLDHAGNRIGQAATYPRWQKID